MSYAMDVLITIFGFLLMGMTIRDVFHQLVHPSGGGTISHKIMQGVWAVFRRIGKSRRQVLVLAGPSAFVCVMAAWTALMTLSWALVYWPQLPEGFSLDFGLDPAENKSFLDAVYFSFVSLTTLGYGDLTPEKGWLRILAPAQAAFGFALLSAGITWLLSIYPTLSSGRALAETADLLRRSNEHGTSLRKVDPSFAASTLLEMTAQLTSLRNELIQFPIIYYFYTQDPRSALPVALPFLLHLGRDNSGDECAPSVRLAAGMLERAVENFTETLAGSFLKVPPAGADEVLAAYAKDHLHSEESRDR